MKQTGTVICGAGIIGIATAYYLAVKFGLRDILLLDKLQPMSLTTSKSGENYRDYWPQQCMTEFSSRSLDLMEDLIGEHGNVFNRRETGYQFVSMLAGTDIFPRAQAAGDKGLQRCTDQATIRQRHPYLHHDVAQLVTIERAGAVDVYALGSLLLSRARAAGVGFLQAEVTAIEPSATGGYRLNILGAEEEINAQQVVLAAGPFTRGLAGQLDIDLPLETVAQRKFVIPDPLGVVPRDMPFTLYADAQYLPWSAEERDMIAADPGYQWLLGELPAGLHIKPESKAQIKLGWAFNRKVEEPVWEIPVDVDFPNIVVRGASRFIPGLGRYIDKLPTPVIQYAGYYTRTRENWPLIGPLSAPGLHCAAGLAGYGTMTACAAGELCARHIADKPLPDYARHFHPGRYTDEAVVAEMALASSDGQL